MQREAPPNYVAGLGRGASGFTTRSDIGSAVPAFLPENQELYDNEDQEADRIWEMVEQKMDERRKSRRELREKLEMDKLQKEKPKISHEFMDLKQNLKTVSEFEWANIPEAMDMTRQRGKKLKTDDERFTAVPDSVLLSNMGQGNVTSIPAVDGTVTNFYEFGRARDQVLGLKLDQMSDSVSGQTNADPKGYLTDLSSVDIKSDSEISDIKKARTLLRSVINTNPKHAPGWIAAARLEEVAGKHTAARDIIAKGCENCPKSEDLWIEAARLNSFENAKIILANAALHIPQSVKIWLRAKELEKDVQDQKKMLRQALEHIPNSVALWKELVSCEEDAENAKVLLSRAVECVPLAIELWLALARLETYANAQKVLNKAGKANPTSYEIWIAAAKLRESNGDGNKVEAIIKECIRRLSGKGAIQSREQWLKEAEICEKEEFLVVCKAIIDCTIDMDLESHEKKHALFEEAEQMVKNSSIHTARQIYVNLANLYPEKKSVWRRFCFFEKSHGTLESLDKALCRAIENCPQLEMLWLMRAKEQWLAGNPGFAEEILNSAFLANPGSEQIWLAAIKLQIETGSTEKAQILLSQAREQANTARVWMKSAVLERQVGNYERALDILNSALDKFPEYPKLWMIKAQILMEDRVDYALARETLQKALATIPKNATLWIIASKLEEKESPLKARACLEKARILNPSDAELWLEALKVELRQGNDAMAKALLAKSLQTCPGSGILWSQAILMESRPQRKAKSSDALKKCENDAHVICTIARLFWEERKFPKARSWFERATKTNPDIGDCWAYWLKFELTHGNVDQQNQVYEGCIQAEPHHGQRWQHVSKNLKNVGKGIKEILILTARGIDNVFE